MYIFSFSASIKSRYKRNKLLLICLRKKLLANSIIYLQVISSLGYIIEKYKQIIVQVMLSFIEVKHHDLCIGVRRNFLGT